LFEKNKCLEERAQEIFVEFFSQRLEEEWLKKLFFNTFAKDQFL